MTLLLVAAALYLTEAFHFINASALRQDEQTNFPQGAMAYMQTHHLPQRTFTAYAWGGYLLWKGYPTYRDFIDGRANTLFDSRILRDYLTAVDVTSGWQSVLKRYRVQNVLVPPTSSLAQALALDTGWRRVYRDSTAVLYTVR